MNGIPLRQVFAEAQLHHRRIALYAREAEHKARKTERSLAELTYARRLYQLALIRVYRTKP